MFWICLLAWNNFSRILNTDALLIRSRKSEFQLAAPRSMLDCIGDKRQILCEFYHLLLCKCLLVYISARWHQIG